MYLLLGAFYWRPVRVLAKADENAHLRYVYDVHQGIWVPRAAPAEEGLWKIDERHQPPLYYWLAAWITQPTTVPDPTTWIEPNPFFLHRAPNGNTARALTTPQGKTFLFAVRAFSWLLGVLVLVGTYRAARTWLPFPASMTAATTLALWPTFLFVQSAASNTALATVWNTLAWSELCLLWTRGVTQGRTLRLGIWLTLALYTRLDSLFLFPAVVLLGLREWRQHHPQWRLPLLAAVGSLLITTPLFLRNVWWYGDPLTRNALAPRPEVLPWRTLLTLETERILKTLFISVGEGFALAPDGYYVPIGFVGVMAIMGWAHLWRQPGRGHVVGFLTLAYLPLVGATLWATRQYYMDAPRYLLSLGTPALLLGVAGYATLWPRSWRPWALVGWLMIWFGINVATISYLLWPLYVPSPAPITDTVKARFENGILLRDSEITLTKSGIVVALTWEATRPISENWAVFLHGYTPDGQLATQEDTHPLYGAFPTSWWPPGFVWRDVYCLPWPPLGPTRLQVYVGLYRPDSQQRLAVYRPEGTPWPHNAVYLGSVQPARTLASTFCHACSTC